MSVTEPATGNGETMTPVVIVRNPTARIRSGIAIIEMDEFVAHVPVGPGSAGARTPKTARATAAPALSGLGRVQVLTTVLKLTPMAVVIGAGLWLVLSEPAAYVQHVPTTPITWSGTIAASTIALFAMLGIESATIPATKVRDPERTIPRATVVAYSKWLVTFAGATDGIEVDSM